MRTPSLLAAVFAALPVVLHANEPASAPARLVASEPSHDLGELTPGEKASHAFVLANQGGEKSSLQVLSVFGPCTIDGLDESIPAGGQASLRVSMDTRELTRPTRCSFRLSSDDPERPTLDFELHVAQRDDLKAKPGQARFQYVRGERAGAIPQLVWAADGAEFQVLSVSAPAQLATSFRRAAEAERRADATGEQWLVDVAIRADAEIGPIEGAIEVHTDHPLQKILRLPVSGFVRPVLHVTPPEGRVPEVELSRDTIFPFAVRNFATESIRLLEATTDLPGVRAEIVPREEGRSWELQVILTRQMTPGPFRGQVTIVTDSPKVPRLEVPLYGTVTVPAAAEPPASGD